MEYASQNLYCSHTSSRACTTKICGHTFSSSPRDEGVGRGPRRGAIQSYGDRRASSPPCDGGEGVVAASPRWDKIVPFRFPNRDVIFARLFARLVVRRSCTRRAALLQKSMKTRIHLVIVLVGNWLSLI